MSTIKFINAVIQKNALTQVHVCVPPWEYALLEGIYGADVQAIDEREVEREVPDPRDEFERLAIRYGPKNADTPIVAAVYGNFGPGVKALALEMSRAKRGESLLRDNEFDDGLPAALTDAEVDAIMNKGDADQAAQLAAIGDDIAASLAGDVKSNGDMTNAAPVVIVEPEVVDAVDLREPEVESNDAAGLV